MKWPRLFSPNRKAHIHLLTVMSVWFAAEPFLFFAQICIKFKRATCTKHCVLFFRVHSRISISSLYNGEFIIAIWNKSQIDLPAVPVCVRDLIAKLVGIVNSVTNFGVYGRMQSESARVSVKAIEGKFNQLINTHGVKKIQSLFDKTNGQ